MHLVGNRTVLPKNENEMLCHMEPQYNVKGGCLGRVFSQIVFCVGGGGDGDEGVGGETGKVTERIDEN